MNLTPPSSSKVVVMMTMMMMVMMVMEAVTFLRLHNSTNNYTFLERVVEL
jgi:CHASE3 domain sensor protein